MFAMLPHLRNLQRAVSSVQHDLLRLCSKNRYILEFLCGVSSLDQKTEMKKNRKRQRENEEEKVEEEVDDGWGGEWEG